MEEIINKLQQDLYEIKENVSFKSLTTFKVGGNASYVISPFTVTSLIECIKLFKENNINFKIWGNGSNILPSDNDYIGVIIKLNKLNNLEVNDTNVKVQAGYSLMKLANEMSKKGLSGLEWACGIPGTIGGAVYMNAGAYKECMADILENVIVLDDNLELKQLSKSDMEFSYRKSVLMKKNYICLEVKLNLINKPIEEIMTVINNRKQRRIESQPLEYPSAGSVFRNPENDYAGRLIEECGLKGYSIGGAEISNKHANFIVNKNNATSKDVMSLIALAKFKVKDKFNIELMQEQELFNWE